MKNPLKYLKHITKDPVTTISEAKARKKEIMPLFFISLGVLVISVVLQTFIDSLIMSIFLLIGLIGVGFCGFLFFVIQKAKQKFTALTCDKCNTMAEIKTIEDFNKYISYTVLKDYAKFTGYSGNNKPTNGIFAVVKYSASSSAVVSVELTCPHCGEVKHLTYNAEPFICHAEANNVSAFEINMVKLTLKNAVQSAVNDYNNPDKRNNIPYSFISSKNPNFENRYKLKGSNNIDAQPEYMGVKIERHKDVEEMLEHYFTYNELLGSIIDPNKPSKIKAQIGTTADTVSDIQEVDSNTELNVTEQQAPTTTYLPQNQPQNDVVAATYQPHADNSDAVKIPTTDTENTDTSNAEKSKKAMPSVFINEKKTSTDKSLTRKGLNKTLLIVTLVVVLIISSFVFGIIIYKQTSELVGTEIIPTESTAEKITTEQVEGGNIINYVGYWSTIWSREQEITINTIDKDYVYFSYWLYGRKPINNVAAQLNGNAAFFSVAVDGAVIKGFLTFETNSIILEITESTSDFVPVETIEFSVHRMFSEEYIIEDDYIEDSYVEDDYFENEPEIEVRPSLNEPPYLISIKNNDNVVYSAASFDSDFVQYIPAGTYTIISEAYDENNMIWGKLKSGKGWICVTNVLYDGHILDVPVSQSADDNEQVVPAEIVTNFNF